MVPTPILFSYSYDSPTFSSNNEIDKIKTKYLFIEKISYIIALLATFFIKFHKCLYILMEGDSLSFDETKQMEEIWVRIRWET